MTAAAPLPPTFDATRQAVHALAEHVLAAVRFAADGHVGLVAEPAGVATPPLAGRVVAVRGAELVDDPGSGRPVRRAIVATLGEAGRFLGVDPGAPPLWTPTTPLDLDADLAVDAAAAEALGGWFALTAAGLAATDPGRPTLWPEHFDLALITVDGAVLGGSPGDAEHPEPYLYASPPRGASTTDPGFWNEPFGASTPYGAVADGDAAAAWFARARARMPA